MTEPSPRKPARVKGGLGRAITQARDRKGWRQLDLANATGLSRSWIAAIESGAIKGREKGSSEKLVVIANALELEPQSLLDLAGARATLSAPPWEEIVTELRALRADVNANRDLMSRLLMELGREASSSADEDRPLVDLLAALYEAILDAGVAIPDAGGPQPQPGGTAGGSAPDRSI